MAGSSPDMSDEPPFDTLEEMSGTYTACPAPCDRGCAPRECTIILPKSMWIQIKFDKEKKCDYLAVAGKLDFKWVELSIDNFLHTILKCVEVKKVVIIDTRGDEKCGDNETLKALCKCFETISPLTRMWLSCSDSSQFSISDAKAIFNVLGVHNTLKECHVCFKDESPTQAMSIKALVDSLLQNPILESVSLELTGHGKFKSLPHEEVHKSNGSVSELGRYMKALTNVLQFLITQDFSDDELVELADLLIDNKQLKRLSLFNSRGQHKEGMTKMGEALPRNSGIEEVTICGFPMGGMVMKSLVQALIPDVTSGIQPNTHLKSLSLSCVSIEDKEGIEQLAALLRSNTSLIRLELDRLNIYQEENDNKDEHIETLFYSLQSNASLEELVLCNNGGIRGKHVLGMIMDMLLYNHTLREIRLTGTDLANDGDAEVVYAELRTRGVIDHKLQEAIQSLEHVPPNFARVFLCGNPEAGKTTLCNKWKEIAHKKTKQPTIQRRRGFFSKFFHFDVMRKPEKAIASQKYASLFDISERTRGIEVHKLVWEGTHISLWDMAGQFEYHAFHDLVLPNQSAKGEGCFYFVVCDPSKYERNDSGGKPLSKLEAYIEYWLMFLASNTRHSASYRPHVTIFMTHHDTWQSNNILCMILRKVVSKLKSKFQQVLDFDRDLDFISMDNKQSCDDAEMVKKRVEQYLKQLCSRLPKVLKASLELQSSIAQWCLENSNDHILKWGDFSRDLFVKVASLKLWKDKGDDYLEKLKKHTTKALHSGGHIIYFEDIDLVIMNPDWFCNHVIGNILFKCSRMSKAWDGVENGIISQDDFVELCKDVLCLGLYKGHYEDTLEIMKKLQICFVDEDKKIMIPSLLTNPGDSMGWKEAFHLCTQSFHYVGTKLRSKDDTITLLSEGFFPRLQVFLNDKIDTNSYKIYMNVISFIYNDINVFIVRKGGSINIMSQSADSGDGDCAHHVLHKKIINDINTLRQKPTLGCPGVILEEHSIWPRCVEDPFNGELQSVSKKHLKDVVLRTGNLKYAYHWVDEKKCAEAVHASKLLEDEEWHKVLDLRAHMVKKMDGILNRQLATSTGREEGAGPSTSDDGGLSCGSEPHEHVLARIESLKRIVQCNHKEVMERFCIMESKIIRSQEALAARVCSNIDDLMKYSLQLKNTNIPKLPYIVQIDDSRKRHLLFKVVPGLKKYHLGFRCEHNDHGFHIMEDQPGCSILVGTDNTRKFGTVMFWGLVTTTMLLKIGAHLAAPGMGNMVPNLAQGLATVLDTPGLLDMAQPRGRILECLPLEFKTNSVISLEDNEQAKEWLVKLVETKAQSIYNMFNLTQVMYVSKSSKKQEMGWVCDAHKPSEVWN